MAGDADRATEAAAAEAEAARGEAEAETQRAVQERAVVLKELDDLRHTLRVVAEQAASLTEQAAEAKKEGRVTKINSALSFVKSAAGRRSVY